MNSLEIGAVGLFGLLVGSFLNVVIYRVPRGESIVSPGSRCTNCGHELTWFEKRIEHWIRFGRITCDQIVDRRRRIVSFRPGAIFAFVRWSANDYGTVSSRIDIVRAIGPDEPFTTLPFVRPGGDILLSIEGWPKVSQVLGHIDIIEPLGYSSFPSRKFSSYSFSFLCSLFS